MIRESKLNEETDQSAKTEPQKYNHALNAEAPDLCAIMNALK